MLGFSSLDVSQTQDVKAAVVWDFRLLSLYADIPYHSLSHFQNTRTLTYMRRHPVLPPYLLFCSKTLYFGPSKFRSHAMAISYWSKGKLHDP